MGIKSAITAAADLQNKTPVHVFSGKLRSSRLFFKTYLKYL